MISLHQMILLIFLLIAVGQPEPVTQTCRSTLKMYSNQVVGKIEKNFFIYYDSATTEYALDEIGFNRVFRVAEYYILKHNNVRSLFVLIIYFMG